MPISVTLDSTACWLLNEPADLSDDVTLELRRRYVAEQGRTALEERRTRQSADVAALKFTLTLEGSWGTAFRAMLRAYDMRPLLVPFWQGLGLVAEISSTLWGSGLRVFFEPDWSHYEIRTDGATAPTSFAASASCCYAPLLWCVFNKLPGDPKALDGETMELQLDLIEAGPAEYALSSTLPILPLYGPTLSTANGLTPRLILPAAADWATAPKLGGIDILYERTQIGCVRQPVDKYAPQDPRRRSTLHLTYSPLELARLLALWQWSDGPVNSWWCEAGYSETTLVAATSSASVEIEVADAAPFASEPYLCLFDGEGLLVGRKIVSIAGNIITLAESPGDIPAEGARVTPLQMVRFSRDTLKIVWKGDLISIQIEVLEQPHETDAGALAGEVLGSTIGTLPALRYGYLVSDGARVWRYTSHDRAINCGATLGTFIPKPIEHGDITMELNLERHDCDLTVGWWEGCPFFERQTDDAAPVLTVTIYEIEAGAESAAKAIFTGDVGPKYSGDVCSATVRGPEAILDTKIPVQVISRRCWAPLYGAKCGLDRAALAVPVALVGVDVSGRLMFEALAMLSLPAVAYAGGYIALSASGSASVRSFVDGAWTWTVTDKTAGGSTICASVTGTPPYGLGIYVRPDVGDQYDPATSTVAVPAGRTYQYGQWNYWEGYQVSQFEALGGAPQTATYDYRSGIVSVAITRPAEATVLAVQLDQSAPSDLPQTGWHIYPGCDKSWSRCQSLGNSDNFRGRPWLPKTNPALVAVSSATSSGSKK